MTLELTPEERELLLQILRDRLGDLREQIHHSRTSEFTDKLKRTEVSLKQLIEKTEQLEQSAS